MTTYGAFEPSACMVKTLLTVDGCCMGGISSRLMDERGLDASTSSEAGALLSRESSGSSRSKLSGSLYIGCSSMASDLRLAGWALSEGAFTGSGAGGTKTGEGSFDDTGGMNSTRGVVSGVTVLELGSMDDWEGDRVNVALRDFVRLLAYNRNQMNSQ